jgi:hypothetical protein
MHNIIAAPGKRAKTLSKRSTTPSSGMLPRDLEINWCWAVKVEDEKKAMSAKSWSQIALNRKEQEFSTRSHAEMNLPRAS